MSRIAPFILLVVLAFQAGYSKNATTIFRVLKPYEGNPKQEVWLQPMLYPYFTFKIERGAMPEAGAINCTTKTEQRSTGGVSYPAVVLECEGGRTLILTGVAFR